MISGLIAVPAGNLHVIQEATTNEVIDIVYGMTTAQANEHVEMLLSKEIDRMFMAEVARESVRKIHEGYAGDYYRA